MALEKVKQAVLQQAREEADRIRAEAEKKAEAEYRQAAERLQREHELEQEQALRQIDEQAALEIQRARTEKSKQLLALKNEAINRIFEAAREELKSMPQDEYKAMLIDWLVRIDPAEDGELVFNREHKDGVGPDVIRSANEQLGRDAYRLSEDTAPIEGGFIFRASTFELDRTFDTILRQLRNEMVSEIADELFQDAESGTTA